MTKSLGVGVSVAARAINLLYLVGLVWAALVVGVTALQVLLWLLAGMTVLAFLSQGLVS